MARDSTNLLPAAFVSAASKQSRELFASAWKDTLFLLVKIGDRADDLSQGLTVASTLTGERLNPSRDSIGFNTAIGESDSFFANFKPRRSLAPGAYDRTTVETQLLRTPHFIVPLRKRPTAGKPFVDRISLGRAPNNDIVLRHASVSKFHAWFECDAERAFYICDAHSSNGTTLNGNPVSSNTPALLGAGDSVSFGQVHATVCPSELLWEVVAA